MTAVTANPLRVGLVGLARDGWHLIESCSVGGPFRVVAVFDTDPQRESHGTSLSVPIVSSLDMLTQSPHIDVLWVATPMGFERELAELLVKHDKHVVVETPLCLSTVAADRAFAAARARGRQLLVHCPRRADADARRAQSVVDSGELGIVRAAKWVCWGYGFAPMDVQSRVSDGVDSPRTTLIRLMAHVLDQLVTLLPAAPLRVFATGALSSGNVPDDSRSLAVSIEFANGALAEIDIRRDSPAVLQTGWVLSGQRGGYAAGQRFTLTPEGEVFDSPTSPLEPAEDELTRLARRLRAAEIDDCEVAHARTVVQLLEAAVKSASERRAVELR